MCLIAWNWQPGSNTPLLVVANRDEFYDRPARGLHWWQDGQVLAGQDLQAGGTWMGVSRSGRLAALTNYRLPTIDPQPRPSRGALVLNYLQGTVSAHDYLADLARHTTHYNPFNLVLFDGHQLFGLQSRNQQMLSLPPGVSAVSNADFDTPWPKLVRLKKQLQDHCTDGRTRASELLPLLQNRCVATNEDLPETGIAMDVERMLSATWIGSTTYGTRASSVVSLGRQHGTFFEQTYGSQGPLDATQITYRFASAPSTC